jgi:hypothetical protein
MRSCPSQRMAYSKRSRAENVRTKSGAPNAVMSDDDNRPRELRLRVARYGEAQWIPRTKSAMVNTL